MNSHSSSPGPVQDAVGDRHLTDIVQLTRQPDPPDLGFGEPEALRGRAGERRDLAEVLAQVGPAFGERCEQHVGALASGRHA